MPFVYDHSGKVKERSRTLESAQGIWQVIGKIRQHDLVRIVITGRLDLRIDLPYNSQEGTVQTAARTYQVATGKRKVVRDLSLQMKRSPADVVSSRGLSLAHLSCHLG